MTPTGRHATTATTAAAAAAVVAVVAVLAAVLAAVPAGSARAQTTGDLGGDLDYVYCGSCIEVAPGFYGDPAREARRLEGDSFPLSFPDPAAPVPEELPPPVGFDPAAPPPRRCRVVPAQPPVPTWAQAPLPAVAGRVHANPYPEGLTGLESWFWWDGSGTDSIRWVQAGRAGVNADCSLTAVPREEFNAYVSSLTWDLADGATATATRGGSEADPAVRHMYETKSRDYVVTVEAVWVGSPQGTRTTPAGSLPYPVIEVIGTLTG